MEFRRVLFRSRWWGDAGKHRGADPLVRAGPPGPALRPSDRAGRRGRRPRTRGSAPPRRCTLLTPRVVIIGGGISGLATAYYLARGGTRFRSTRHIVRTGGL